MNTQGLPPQADPLIRPAVLGGPDKSRWLVALFASLAALLSLAIPSANQVAPIALVVLDLSQSMRAGIPPRYQIAHDHIIQLANNISGPLGLITFASNARLASPPTLDQTNLINCLNNLPSEAMRPELLPSPESTSGTRVSSGLGLAFTMLKNRPGHRAVVLISDGDDPAPDEQATLLAASMAATGIQLVVIPVGQALPESIPTSTGWLEWQGKRVYSQTDTRRLGAIAAAAGTGLASRTGSISLITKNSFNYSFICLLASFALWVCFLIRPFFPTRRPLLAILLPLAFISSCSAQNPNDPSFQILEAQSLIKQAEALPTTNLARAPLARRAESLLRQSLAHNDAPTTQMAILRAMVLVGESVPMDKNALLAAKEFSLEWADLLGPNFETWSARIRLRLAQCPPNGANPTKQTVSPSENRTSEGDPGGRAQSTSQKTTSQATPSTDIDSGIPGAGRLPVVLDTNQTQPFTQEEVLALLRSAFLRRQRTSSSPDSWDRPTTEVPDW